jgi:hypothetical protein
VLPMPTFPAWVTIRPLRVEEPTVNSGHQLVDWWCPPKGAPTGWWCRCQCRPTATRRDWKSPKRRTGGVIESELGLRDGTDCSGTSSGLHRDDCTGARAGSCSQCGGTAYRSRAVRAHVGERHRRVATLVEHPSYDQMRNCNDFGNDQDGRKQPYSTSDDCTKEALPPNARRPLRKTCWHRK